MTKEENSKNDAFCVSRAAHSGGLGPNIDNVLVEDFLVSDHNGLMFLALLQH